MGTKSAPGAVTSAQLTPDQLIRNAIHRRAIEAIVWGMPAVNTDLMYQAMVREVKGAWNQIVYWSRLLDWKNQTLTPLRPRGPRRTGIELGADQSGWRV